MTKQAFDIASKSVKPTTTIELEGPDGESLVNEDGENLSITIYGPGSKEHSKAQDERNEAILESVRRGKKKVGHGKQREMDAEFLAKCTKSFNGFVYKDFEPGYHMFKAAYSDTSIGYIAEQVNKELGEWGNFT